MSGCKKRAADAAAAADATIAAFGDTKWPRTSSRPTFLFCKPNQQVVEVLSRIGRVVTFTDFKTWPNSMPNTTHPSHPRQWYSRAPGGPNYQHRSEFCFSLALAENPQVEHQASSPRSSPRRRESDPSPQPGLGMYKRTLRDPAQVAGNLNSKIKFGVHQRLAESAPLIAGASKAVPLLYLHACSGCNGEARRSRSRAHPGSGPVTDPGPSIFHKFSPPPAGLLRKRWTFNLAEK